MLSQKWLNALMDAQHQSKFLISGRICMVSLRSPKVSLSLLERFYQLQSGAALLFRFEPAAQGPYFARQLTNTLQLIGQLALKHLICVRTFIAGPPELAEYIETMELSLEGMTLVKLSDPVDSTASVMSIAQSPASAHPFPVCPSLKGPHIRQLPPLRRETAWPS